MEKEKNEDYKMKVIKINEKNLKDAVVIAAKYLGEGKTVVYPTETAYALGVDAMNENALLELCRIKKRPLYIPMLVLVYDLEMIKEYGYIDKRIEILVEKFMPGPLTIAIKKRKFVPDLLNPEGISFRISSNPIATEIVKNVGRPITGTSANLHKKPLIYNPQKILDFFSQSVDLFIDSGILPKNPPSTVIDLKPKIPRVIREGALDSRLIFEELERGGMMK
ncbi:MAG: L-threonylcarbamoyladenylate synthase [Candidatus Methanofastidiosia archaeon]